MTKLEELQSELIIAYQNYINLLGSEISDMSIVATIHHWRSNRINDGFECRKEIEELLSKIKEIEK
jgi:hypothetical protein